MTYDEKLADRVRELIAVNEAFTEQRMLGGLMVRVDPEGVRTRRQLEPWVRRGVSYARSLPPK